VHTIDFRPRQRRVRGDYRTLISSQDFRLRHRLSRVPRLTRTSVDGSGTAASETNAYVSSAPTVTFGGGHDLNVGFDVLGNRESALLDVGYEEAYSYGQGLVYDDDLGLLPLNALRCGAHCGFGTFGP
jgi:hypothetical protein